MASGSAGRPLSAQARRRSTNAGFECGVLLRSCAYVTSGREYPTRHVRLRGPGAAPLLLMALAGVMLTGCGRPPGDAAAEIAALVASASEAVRKRDVAGLQGVISDNYEDGEGRDNRAMGFLIRSWLGRYPNIFVVVTDLRVQSISGDLATARMAVNVVARESGRPLPIGLDADRLRLRLALRREGGEWRVTRADWGRSEGPESGTTN